jgi:flagellar protein FlbD
LGALKRPPPKPEDRMIELHRLDDTKILINTDLMESVEEIHDTVITLTNGNKYIVREKIQEIMEKVVDFKRFIHIRTMVEEKSLKKKK